MNHYTIAIDVMGGDYGPAITVPAALNILQQNKEVDLILVGDETAVNQQLQAAPSSLKSRYRVQHSIQQVEMDEPPLLALRNKRESSMRIALNLVRQGQAIACVSAGNTGALMAMARFVLSTLPGIDRPAITALLPTLKPGRYVRLLDLGANVDVRTEHLFQFAVMGTTLAAEVDDIVKPKLALLNIGSEAGKGNLQVRKADELFSSQAQVLNYQGYIEGNTLFHGDVDIVVCDGFIGNIALKVAEGVAKLLSTTLKQAFNRHWLAQLIGLAAKPILRSAYHKFDPARYNGASLVGLQGIVIKSHGGADIQAFTHAIQQAIVEVERSVPHCIQERVVSLLQAPFAS